MPRISEIAPYKGFTGVYMQRPELHKAMEFTYGALWELSLIHI